MRIVAGALCALLFVAIIPGPPLDASASCADLSKLSLPNTVITAAETVAAGAFAPPGAASADGARALPAFCRVAATLKPTTDSDIKMEVWLPASGWNGKFQAVGNGAFSGAIAYPAMMTALARGYATGSTDTGHTGGSAEFGLGHPEKVIDFGWRAVHEMTDTSKKIIAAHYSTAPTFSYFNGCSAGGRQALKAAQRFPSDFIGIVAGAPGLDWTGRAAQAVRVAKSLEQNQAGRLSQAQRELLHSAALDACDAADGLKDGLIESPKRCAFDPAILECKGSEGATCLTKAQVETARLIYSAPLNPKTKRVITGLLPGSELGWTDLGWTASARATGLDQFRFLVFGDRNWNVQAFNFDADIARAEDLDNNTINALDPNLKPFIDRGGKLIQYHGWSDPQISPENSTQYYSRVLELLGGQAKVHGSYRLFMAPGMGHCGGGEGPNSFDMVAALEDWVERGKAPDRIVASHATRGRVDRTRPLCPYPQVAVYTGTGSIDEAASFACGNPPSGTGVAAGATAALHYDPAAKLEITVSDVEFRRTKAGRVLMARIYQPVGPGPFPTVLDLHGGAWNGKDRFAEEPMDRAIAASGVLVVAIDMTLAPEAPYPASVQDANYAVRWLKWKAPSWKGDPSKIGVYGSSSGGHVAELLAMRPRDPRYNAIPLPEAPNVDATVAYVAMRSPISNTHARFQNAETLKRDAMVKNNTTFFQPWDTIHESNPQEILERHEPVTLVPFLIMQGALDDNVLPAVQEKFVATYRAAGGQITYALFKDSVHEWVAQPGPRTDEAREMVKAFIARQLKAR